METNTAQAGSTETIEAAVKQAIIDAGITYRITNCGERVREGNWKCDGWMFTFQRGWSGKPVEFEYFTGTGHRKPHVLKSLDLPARPVTPPVAGLIHSLVMDDTQGQDFSEWCSNYGYDDDSRKAMATYEQCQRQTRKARELFGRELFAKFAELTADY